MRNWNVHMYKLNEHLKMGRIYKYEKLYDEL